MQPLFSPVDHESRNHGSYRINDSNEPTENTPLITTGQVARSIAESRNPITTIVVTILLLILIIGVIIGIYLLAEQRDFLPPVEPPLLFVSRIQWNKSNSTKLLHNLPPTTPAASLVIIVQTDTRTCSNTEDCEQLLGEMQKNLSTESENRLLLPYNFMVSTDGETFQGLGWGRPSPLFPQYSNSSLVLAFIGNFTTILPKKSQIVQAKEFFDESVSQGRLQPHFSVIGKNTKEKPILLFRTLSGLPQWNSELSDS